MGNFKDIVESVKGLSTKDVNDQIQQIKEHVKQQNDKMQVSIDYNKEEITNNYQKFEKFESQIKTDNIDNQESISSLKKMQMQMLKQISSL